MTDITPIANRVLVRHDPIEEETLPSGIIIPEMAQPKPMIATVVATGDKLANPIPLGSRIMIGKYAGHTIEVNKETLTIVREDEIMGIVEEE